MLLLHDGPCSEQKLTHQILPQRSRYTSAIILRASASHCYRCLLFFFINKCFYSLCTYHFILLKLCILFLIACCACSLLCKLLAVQKNFFFLAVRCEIGIVMSCIETLQAFAVAHCTAAGNLQSALLQSEWGLASVKCVLHCTWIYNPTVVLLPWFLIAETTSL